MAHTWTDYGPTQPLGTGDLSPLDDNLRAGLAVIGALAVVSLILCTSIFSFITYRVIQGRLNAPPRPRCSRSRLIPRLPVPLKHRTRQDQLRSHASYNAIEMAGKYAVSPVSPASDPLPRQQFLDATEEATLGIVPNIRRRYQGYNPLLVLIYMLLIADIIQSTSFIPNIVWIKHNAITVRSETCWAQGWLRSQGDVASAMFAAAVSINTYILVVHRYTISSKALRLIVASIWSFSFIIVAAGVWASNNGKDHGGYFVRVDTWCWISQEYAGYRLWTHFSWVLAMLSIIILAFIGTAIKIRVPDSYGPARGPLRLLWSVRFQLRNPRRTGHHPAFLIYPLIYFACCAPMAIGPMILESGVSVKQGYFLWAGAMIASNGWLDVVLWSLTMIFLAPKDIKQAGLSDFALLRTPSVEYGNMVWVEAGSSGGGNKSSSRCGGMLACILGRKSARDRRRDDKRQDGITTELVTSVVVERNPARATDGVVRLPVHPETEGGILPRPSFVYAREDIVTVPRRVAHRF